MYKNVSKYIKLFKKCIKMYEDAYKCKTIKKQYFTRNWGILFDFGPGGQNRRLEGLSLVGQKSLKRLCNV